MPTLNLVTYSTMMEYDEKAYVETLKQLNGTGYTEMLKGRDTLPRGNELYADKLKAHVNMVEQTKGKHTQFLKDCSPDEFYFFIIAKNGQNVYFNDFMEKFKLERFIKYRSKEVPNKNHGPTPRLTVYIFQFSEEFLKEFK